MLDVTPAASRAIGTLVTVSSEDETGGLRIAVAAELNDAVEITLAFSAGPQQGDEVVMTSTGSQVFLDAGAAYHLSDKVLDVQRGQAGDLQFAFDRKN